VKKESTYMKYLPWIIWTAGAVFYCYEYLLRLLPSVMTTDLMRSYHVSAAVLGNLAAFYYYAYTPMQLPVGVMMDRYGPRRLLTFACLSCAVGSYLFASTGYLSIAEIGRFLVGFGSAFAFVGVLKLATIWLPPERFAMMAGLASSLGTFGGISGAIGLTAMVEWVGWHDTVFYSAVLGAVLTVLLYLIIRDKPEGGPKNPASEETTLKQVISDLKEIMKMPAMWVNGLIGCLIYLPTTAFAELWAIPYFEQAHNFTHQQSAYAVSMLFLGWGIGAPLAGWVSDHINRRKLPLVAGCILAAVLVSILLYVPLSKGVVYALMMLLGASYSVQVIVFAIGAELCPPRASGSAIAVTNMLVMLGGAIFQPLVGYLLEFRWAGRTMLGVHVFNEVEYQFAFAILPIAMIMGVLLIILLPETHPLRESAGKKS